MIDWKELNRRRVPPSVDPVYGSTPEDGFNGFFCLRINGLNVKAIASLWEPVGKDFPKPDRLLVGVRDVDDMRRANESPYSPVKFIIPS